jgi:hypothetical protein
LGITNRFNQAEIDSSETCARVVLDSSTND